MSLAATLNCIESRQVGCEICRGGDVHEDGDTDSRKVEKVEECMQTLEEKWRR